MIAGALLLLALTAVVQLRKPYVPAPVTEISSIGPISGYQPLAD
jgi:hypothetical protein